VTKLEREKNELAPAAAVPPPHVHSQGERDPPAVQFAEVRETRIGAGTPFMVPGRSMVSSIRNSPSPS